MVMVTIFGGSIMCVVTVSPGKLIPCSGMASDAKWSTWTVDKWGWLVNHMRVSIYVICSDVSKHSLMFHPAAHVVATHINTALVVLCDRVARLSA